MGGNGRDVYDSGSSRRARDVTYRSVGLGD